MNQRPLAALLSCALAAGLALAGGSMSSATTPSASDGGSLRIAPEATWTPTAQTRADARAAVAGSESATPGSFADLMSRSRKSDTRAYNPQVTFFAGLPRDSAVLTDAAVKASTPVRLPYRDHLTLNEAAKAYGAKSSAIKKLNQTAAELAVTVEIDRSRLFARLTAPLSRWEKLYGVKASIIDPTAAEPFRSIIFANDKGFLGAPKQLADATREWVAMYSVYAPKSDIQGIDPDLVEEFETLLSSTGDPKKWPTNNGTPRDSQCQQAAITDGKVYGPEQIRRAYGATALSDRGWTGKDTRLAIVSMGNGFNPLDIQQASKCFGYRQPKISVRLGTGVTQQFLNFGAEAHLDIITASWSMPDAETIRVIQVPSIGLGFTDGIARGLDRDESGEKANDVVSVSYGICEAEYKADFGRLMPLNEDLLQMGAVIGTGFLFASGDNGTSMCGAEASVEAQTPLVFYPASSPWVTAVGGTRLYLGEGNVRTNEHAWNDMPFVSGYPDPVTPGPAGSGGPSLAFDRPWYQRTATPVGPRLLPDVAVLGAMRPGWPVFYDGTLFTVGGTSGGTPFLAANFALMNAGERARGYPGLGFLNPWLYRVAANPDAPPFYDVVKGSNAVQPVPCCVAYRGFDMATGLGAPKLGVLMRQIIPPFG